MPFDRRGAPTTSGGVVVNRRDAIGWERLPRKVFHGQNLMATRSTKRRGGRPRLSDSEKLRRGTLRPHRVRGPSKATRPRPAAQRPKPKDYALVAAQYAADVESGRIVACRWVRLACERQSRDRLRAATDETWPYVWSDTHVAEACAFIEKLPHVEGRWATPTIQLDPWQVFLVACLFGWRQRADLSRRRFTNLYLETGRKAAKSTLMAAIMLFHLLKEHEPGASAICGATTGLQARVVFAIAQRMVRRSAFLRDLGAVAFANAILCGDGTAKPVNAKATSLDGLNPSLIVLDESHAQTFELHDVLKSSQGARANPLMVCPTTAGYDLLSVGYALRTQVTKILQRVFDAEHLFGIVYTLDDGDDWRDERVWIKANPMIGITPTFEWVRTYCQDAQQAPGVEGEFKVKICSQWASSASAWLSMSSWDRCADDHLRLEQFEGEPCWIGADLAQLDDLAAVALVFRRADLVIGFVRAYLPADVVAERARAVPAYRQWADAGLLVLTDGTLIDYARIEADIRAFCKRFKVAEIVFDQYGSTMIVSNLQNDKLPAVIESKNAKSFTPAARELESRIKHGRFRHDGSSLLKWSASNAVVTRKIDDSILPKKESPESPNKIDPLDALLQGIGAMLRAAPAKPKTYAMHFFGGVRP